MAELTTTVLTGNGFALSSNGNYEKSVEIEGDEVIVGFDPVFHICMNDNAYPMCTTVEDANTQLAALETGIVLS
jgi:hypothetical protein